MRIKKKYIVLSFHTTAEAMAWEKACLSAQIPGRLIPLPREISAGCGLAWRMLPDDWIEYRPRFDAKKFDQVTEVEQ